jgi:ABC-type glycerol-3-phosphate transport system substrate-binding protein
MYAGTRVIVYNRELLEAAGIAEPTVTDPWSFDEFKQNAIKLTQDTNGDGVTDQFGFGTSARFMSQFLPFIWAKGGEILNPEMTAATVNTPEWKSALEFYIDLLHRVSPPGSVNIPLADIQKMFGAGQVAMFITTIDFVMELIKDPVVKERTAVGPMPHYNGKQANFLGTDVFVITRQSEHPEKAWKFLRYMLTPENQMAYNKIVGFMPVLKAVADDPYFTEDRFRLPFIQALDYGRFFVQSGRAPAITSIMRAEVQQAVEGGKTIEEALKEMEKAINIALR